MSALRRTTLDPAEHEHFSRQGANWWKADGPLAALHHFNPARLAALLGAVRSAFPNQPSRQPLTGLDLLDIGCGGGIFAETLARAGAKVTGLDASAEAIRAARTHAKEQNLPITYRTGTLEQEAAGKNRYDIITASEVIEHVADPALFVESAAHLLKPGGLFFLTTLNRTPTAYALAIVAAEHLLHLAPRGTHEWQKFLKPSELADLCAQAGLELNGTMGFVYHPLAGRFTASPRRLEINYALWAGKPKARSVRTSGKARRAART